MRNEYAESDFNQKSNPTIKRAIASTVTSNTNTLNLVSTK